MPKDEVTLETVQAGAELARLPLTPEEAQEILPGVQRMKQMAESVRSLMDASLEPASVFQARKE
jgi:Asp-tRNA(Asn)/Glu-tRNA(Gln) amidotransferase C subunit